MSPVVRAVHTGFTVQSIEKLSLFFRGCLQLEVSAPRSPPPAVLPAVTGVAGAQALIAMVTLPGHVIELLEYLSPHSATRSAPRPCDIGSAHIALEVVDMSAIVAAAPAYGFDLAGTIFVADQGPFCGRPVAYIRDRCGFTIELIGAAAQTDGATLTR